MFENFSYYAPRIRAQRSESDIVISYHQRCGSGIREYAVGSNIRNLVPHDIQKELNNLVKPLILDKDVLNYRDLDNKSKHLNVQIQDLIEPCNNVESERKRKDELSSKNAKTSNEKETEKEKDSWLERRNAWKKDTIELVPCIFKLNKLTKKYQIESEINDLPLLKYKQLYKIIEDIFTLYEPHINKLLQRTVVKPRNESNTMANNEQNEENEDIIDYYDYNNTGDDYDRSRYQVVVKMQDYQFIRPSTEGKENKENKDNKDNKDDEKLKGETTIAKTNADGTNTGDSSSSNEFERIQDRRYRDYDGGMKLSDENIKLYCYGGGNWHKEGKKIENVACVGLYYFDISDNIDGGSLSFAYPQMGRGLRGKKTINISNNQSVIFTNGGDLVHKPEMIGVIAKKNEDIKLNMQFEEYPTISKDKYDNDIIATRKLLAFFVIDPIRPYKDEFTSIKMITNLKYNSRYIVKNWSRGDGYKLDVSKDLVNLIVKYTVGSKEYIKEKCNKVRNKRTKAPKQYCNENNDWSSTEAMLSESNWAMFTMD